MILNRKVLRALFHLNINWVPLKIIFLPNYCVKLSSQNSRILTYAQVFLKNFALYFNKNLNFERYPISNF